MKSTANIIFDMIDEAIETGELNTDDLKSISDFAFTRAKDARKAEGRKVAARLSKGTAVRIKLDAPLGPRYILGVEATVEKVNQTTATIILGDLDHDGGRFRAGQRINCPLDALELVEKGEPWML